MKLETKILIYQYFIAIVAIILIVINIVGVIDGKELINNYEVKFTGKSVGVITGKSTGGRWLHYGIEWRDASDQIHRGSNKLPISNYSIGDSVKIRYDTLNPKNFMLDIHSEIYHPLQNAIILLVISISLLIFNISMIYLYYKSRQTFMMIAKRFFKNVNNERNSDK